MDAVVPAQLNAPAYALKNQFELPVLFYALCLYLYQAGYVDEYYVLGSWLFVAGRVVHAMIYCTYNNVLHRFIAYFLSGLTLWVMIARAMLAAFGVTAN